MAPRSRTRTADCSEDWCTPLLELLVECRESLDCNWHRQNTDATEGQTEKGESSAARRVQAIARRIAGLR